METYAIAKVDLLHKGEGEDAEIEPVPAKFSRIIDHNFFCEPQ